MSSVQPVRFEDGRPMLLAGLRRRHRLVDAARDIPQQWREFVDLGPIPGAVNDAEYGADCGADCGAAGDAFEYLCAVEVADFSALPGSINRIRVPAVRYAIFEHVGSLDGLHATWTAILHHWLPNSVYVTTSTPDFERYDARFDRAARSGVVEIWIGIQPKSAGYPPVA